MKIVCDACTAKYSIADEKVAGKVFKIRCKKCENIIVVRGHTAAQAQRVLAEGEWYVVINQEQTGPMTENEVRRRFSEGEIDSESYIWREGFTDWERAVDVTEFSDFGRSRAPSSAGTVPIVESRSGSQDSFGARTEPNPDLFGGAAAAAGRGSDIFSGVDSSIGENTGQIAMSKESEAQLKGQRNENSVLFSLGNLAALAEDGRESSQPHRSGTSSGTVDSGGGGEGSGLIDIRSMASVYLADKGAVGTPVSSIGTADDLPVFNQSSFENASPVLLPTHASDGDNKVLYMLVAVIAALVVAASILIVIVLRTGDEGEAAASHAVIPNDGGTTNHTFVASTGTDSSPDVASDTPTANGGATDEITGNVGSEGPEASTQDAGVTPTEKDTKTKVASDRKKESSSKSGAKTDRGRKSEKRNGTGATAVSTSEKLGKAGNCDEVSCLLEPNRACCEKYNTFKGKSARETSNLPERPSRSDITTGIGKIKSRVASCGDKHGGSGTVTVLLKISGAGKVTSASATGGSSSGLRNCVTSVVKSAVFAKTQKGRPVRYPFIF